MIHGIDVSAYQSATPPIAGCQFIFIKASEGSSWKNPKLADQVAWARRHGLSVGFYHFAHTQNSVTSDLANFKNAIAGHGTWGDMIALDWEPYGQGGTPRSLTAWKDAWLRKAQGLWPRHRVGLYVNRDQWLNVDKSDFRGDFLWIADYVRGGYPRIKAPFQFHQYSDKPLDTDVGMFSSKQSLIDWALKGGGPVRKVVKPVVAKAVAVKAKAVSKLPVKQRDRVIQIAKTQIGYHEGRANGHWNNQEKYAPQVKSLRWAQGQAWCDVFVAWVMQSAGIQIPTSASCAQSVAQWKRLKRFSDYPAIGAQVFFGQGGGSHTGIVVGYNATVIQTVEGNTNVNGSSEGDGVYFKTHVRKDPHVYGYGYPAFKEGIVSADPAWKGRK